MEVQSMLSARGKKLLILDGHKFSKAHASKCGRIRWRCITRTCNSKLYTKSDEKTVIESSIHHNHEADNTLNRQIVSNGLKRKAVEDLFERPSKLLHKELRNNGLTQEMELECKDLHCIRKNLYIARKKVISTLPTNQKEVFKAIQKPQPKTNKDEENLNCWDAESGVQDITIHEDDWKCKYEFPMIKLEPNYEIAFCDVQDSNTEMEILPPERLKMPLVVPNKLMMGPGPSNCSPRVLHAMGYPVIGHLHSETLKIMDEVKAGIKYIFQTNNSLTLCISGTGHAGMEASLDNILEPGNKALFPTNGLWGSRAADMARRCGAVAIQMNKTPGISFTLSELENAIILHKPDVLFITQGESSTGVLQPLEGLGDVCHKYNCLLIVDAVASLGGTPLYMDKWNIDVLYTGSQKVLGVPPGITPISFSALAKKRLFERKAPGPVYYWDMKLLGEYWGCFEGKPRIYHHTIPVNLLYGLREGLAQLCEETLQECQERHQKCSTQLYDGLKQLGLQLFVEESSDRLPTVTAVKVPDNVDWKKIISYAMDRYCLEISGGLGPTVGQIFRIGIMGYNATSENVERTLSVLDEALKQAKMMIISKF